MNKISRLLVVMIFPLLTSTLITPLDNSWQMVKSNSSYVGNFIKDHFTTDSLSRMYEDNPKTCLVVGSVGASVALTAGVTYLLTKKYLNSNSEMASLQTLYDQLNQVNTNLNKNHEALARMYANLTKSTEQIKIERDQAIDLTRIALISAAYDPSLSISNDELKIVQETLRNANYSNDLSYQNFQDKFNQGSNKNSQNNNHDSFLKNLRSFLDKFFFPRSYPSQKAKFASNSFAKFIENLFSLFTDNLKKPVLTRNASTEISGLNSGQRSNNQSFGNTGDTSDSDVDQVEVEIIPAQRGTILNSSLTGPHDQNNNNIVPTQSACTQPALSMPNNGINTTNTEPKKNSDQPSSPKQKVNTDKDVPSVEKEEALQSDVNLSNNDPKTTIVTQNAADIVQADAQR